MRNQYQVKQQDPYSHEAYKLEGKSMYTVVDKQDDSDEGYEDPKRPKHTNVLKIR